MKFWTAYAEGAPHMACFAICFQLKNGSEVARRRFCDEVERLGGIEAVDRFYLIELDGDAAEVHDYLRKLLAERDLLVVLEFEKPPGAAVASAGSQSWIGERFPMP